MSSVKANERNIKPGMCRLVIRNTSLDTEMHFAAGLSQKANNRGLTSWSCCQVDEGQENIFSESSLKSRKRG